MKTINHNEGNFHYVNDSVMYGSIYMEKWEWDTVNKYLRMRYAQSKINENEGYLEQQLWGFCDSQNTVNRLKNIKEGKPFCIGVEATRLIFEAFGLPRYKKQNYSITVTV